MTTSFAAVPSAENHPLPSEVLSPPPVIQPSTVGVDEENIFKIKLQEYAQRSSLPLPMYQSVKEGPPQALMFRAAVWVNGAQYLSSTSFSTRKTAEHDAARVALASIPEPHIVQEGMCPDIYPFIHQDTTFCKSILNEYSAKRRIERPIYNTIESGTKLPVFTSSVVLDGTTYNGLAAGRNKKEAEQLAARAGVLSILESVHRQEIYEIIMSKLKLFAAINGLKETSSGSNAYPVVNLQLQDLPLDFNTNKRNQDTMNFSTPTQTTPLSVHEFKKPKVDADMASVPPLIAFVPARSEMGPSSMSGANQNRKKKNKKKKAKKGPQGNYEVSSAVVLHPGTE